MNAWFEYGKSFFNLQGWWAADSNAPIDPGHFQVKTFSSTQEALDYLGVKGASPTAVEISDAAEKLKNAFRSRMEKVTPPIAKEFEKGILNVQAARDRALRDLFSSTVAENE